MSSNYSASSLAEERDAWDRYHLWNMALAEELFSERFRGQPVYLDLEQQILKKLAESIGETHDDLNSVFSDMVAATLNLSSRAGLVFGKHESLVKRWRKERSLDPPPCLALLGFFSLVAEAMVGDKRFSPANYYGRLLQHLKIKSEPRTLREKIERDFRKQTPAFWQALNTWLDDAEGALGTPTAFAFDHRRFVSIPISQALFRKADRGKLTRFFAEYGMQPGERMSVSDMKRLLSDWLPSSTLNTLLKNLWKTPAGKERMANMVCVELEGWDGIFPDGTNYEMKYSQIQLLAQERKRPKLGVNFMPMVRNTESIPRGSYTVSGNSVGIFGNSAVDLKQSPLENWLKFDSRHPLSSAELLINNLDLVYKNGFKLGRQANHLILFRYSDEQRIYEEVSRATLAERHLVLSYDSLLSDVRHHLDINARSGFEECGHTAIQGLPPNWTLFRNVSLLGARVAKNARERELDPLLPSALTTVALDNGFVLPGRATWHKEKAPELTIMVPGESEHQVLIETENMIAKEKIEAFVGAQTFKLENLKLGNGDFRVRVEKVDTRQAIATRNFRLRSGDQPRSVAVGVDESVCLGGIENDLWPLGVPNQERENGEWVRGAVVNIKTPAVNNVSEIPFTIPRELDLSGTAETMPAVINPPIKVTTKTSKCMKNGYHHWILQSGETQYPKNPVEATCKDCKRVRMFLPRGLKRHTGRRSRTARRDRETIQPVTLPQITEAAGFGMDLLLDAISYARGGTWPSLVRMTSQVNDDPFFPFTCSRKLVALGHIDVVVKPNNFKPVSWKVSPSTLALISERTAVLCGARSEKLLKRLEEDVSALDGKYEEQKMPDSPKIIRIRGLGKSTLKEVVDSVSKALSCDLFLSEDPGYQIACHLPSLFSIKSALSEEDMPFQVNNLEYFDCRHLKWSPTQNRDRPGAYRFGKYQRTYGLIEECNLGRNKILPADWRTVKHLAALLNGKPLVAYNPEQKILYAPLGAELPGLYERAAVLCAGKPPCQRGGRIEYQQVRQSVAKYICSAISGPL